MREAHDTLRANPAEAMVRERAVRDLPSFRAAITETKSAPPHARIGGSTGQWSRRAHGRENVRTHPNDGKSVWRLPGLPIRGFARTRLTAPTESPRLARRNEAMHAAAW
jgi:hypothetical protein